MCQHEIKKCPRCERPFECKVGAIAQCQCFVIELSLEEKAFIEGRYNDCLCAGCLQELKNRYTFFREKYFFR